jgi:hypothetical protein
VAAALRWGTKRRRPMIWNVDPAWLAMAIAVVAGISYMLALLMEPSIGSNGFGAFGNTVLITAGFFLGIYCANEYGVSIKALKYALLIGLSGSFAILLSMFLLRGLWSRI